jgi:gamma-glutamylcyclotransferase (GGCT)/AIG2-like uncharacterized protein YtfP
MNKMETQKEKVIRENLGIGAFVIIDEKSEADEYAFAENKRIFVYGTLRKGEGLNPYLDNFKFLGAGKLKGYDMYSNGSYPMIVKGEGEVVGELYEINGGANEIECLDRIECAYDRTKVKIKIRNETISAETYVFKTGVNHLRKIQSGNWILRF